MLPTTSILYTIVCWPETGQALSKIVTVNELLELALPGGGVQETDIDISFPKGEFG